MPCQSPLLDYCLYTRSDMRQSMLRPSIHSQACPCRWRLHMHAKCCMLVPRHTSKGDCIFICILSCCMLVSCRIALWLLFLHDNLTSSALAAGVEFHHPGTPQSPEQSPAVHAHIVLWQFSLCKAYAAIIMSRRQPSKGMKSVVGFHASMYHGHAPTFKRPPNDKAHQHIN